MSVCDVCKQHSEQYRDIGPVVLGAKGYNCDGKGMQWLLDLCPKCAGTLKAKLDEFVRLFRAG